MSLFGPGPSWERIIGVWEPALHLRALIVLHSLARGPAFGGVRRVAYVSEDAGLRDAKQLAEAMSQKCALAGLPAGGGKSVIFDDPALADPSRRAAAYEALGAAIAKLGGDYVCGPDIGTGPAELDALRRATTWVNPAQNDAGASTAASVLAGLRGLSEVVFDSRDLGGRRYVIQGLGAVGSALAEDLVAAGGRVAGFDPDPAARARARALGVELLDEAALLREPCDVFMPCALGGTLSASVCEQASWRAVCGSANNQLVDERAAAILKRRSIAWAPDFVVNAGAVIEGVRTVLGSDHSEAHVRAQIAADIAAIRDRCAALLVRAREADRSPLDLAREAAHAALRDSTRRG